MLLVLAASASLYAAPALAAPLTVAVAIAPQNFFVSRIGGELVAVETLVPPGSDAHVYEPRPRRMAALEKAVLYFSLGLDFERAWLPRFKAANAGLTVVDMAANVPKRPMAHEHAHDADHDADHEADHAAGHGPARETGAGGEPEHDHGGLDPHVWLSPPLARILADNVLAALTAADPANAAAYRANHARLVAEVESLDRDLRALFADVAPGKNRFFVYHPAWGYFADAYGLVQEAVEVEGKEPGPRELAQLIGQARKLGVNAVFVEPQFSQKSASVIASGIGGKTEVIDPLAGDWDANLRRAAAAVRRALR